MFLVTAVIRPHKLNEVADALKTMGVGGITTSQAHGYGSTGGHISRYRTATYEVDHTPKIRLDVVADGWTVDDIVKVVTVAARTGAGGDGCVWVTRLCGVTRVRTGEAGPEAI